MSKSEMYAVGFYAFMPSLTVGDLILMFDNIFHFKVDFLETSGRESRGGGSLGICSGGTLSSLIIFCLFVEHCGGTFDNLLSFCGTLWWNI